MKLLFASDVHLKEHQSSEYIQFLNFLKNILKSKDVDHLFLVGDIFDLWISDKPVFFNHFSDVINLLFNIAKQGTQVHYFEGNHDVHLNKFFKNKENIKIYSSPQFFCFDGLNLKVEHGDLINKNDHLYFKWKKIINSEIFEKIFRIFPGFLVLYLAFSSNLLNSLKRKILFFHNKSVIKNFKEEDIRKMLHNYAEVVCKDEDVDLFINGHVHVADVYKYKIMEKEKQAINLGEWIKQPHVLSIIDKNIQLNKLEHFLSLPKS